MFWDILVIAILILLNAVSFIFRTKYNFYIKRMNVTIKIALIFLVLILIVLMIYSGLDEITISIGSVLLISVILSIFVKEYFDTIEEKDVTSELAKPVYSDAENELNSHEQLAD